MDQKAMHTVIEGVRSDATIVVHMQPGARYQSARTNVDAYTVPVAA